MTVRQAGATTLQALELTNGGTLAALLRQGATKVWADASCSRRSVGLLALPPSPRAPPNRQQVPGLAASLVGAPARTEGVEDLLGAGPAA